MIARKSFDRQGRMELASSWRRARSFFASSLPLVNDTHVEVQILEQGDCLAAQGFLSVALLLRDHVLQLDRNDLTPSSMEQ